MPKRGRHVEGASGVAAGSDDVRVAGQRDGAVMGGVVNLRGTDGSKPFSVTLRFADIWAKRNGKWQVIYTHVSRPPAE
jgi:hypothetical protein